MPQLQSQLISYLVGEDIFLGKIKGGNIYFHILVVGSIHSHKN